MPGVDKKLGVDQTHPIITWAQDRSVFDPLGTQIAKRLVSGGLKVGETLLGSSKDNPGTLMNQMMVPGVAAVAPQALGMVKAKGKALIDKIKSEGLPVSRNGFPSYIDVPNAGQLPDQFIDWSAHSGPEPNIKLEGHPVYEKLMQALEHAQRKYPRLFGHIGGIENVDRGVQDQLKSGSMLGASVPAIGQGKLADKVSYLEFDPEQMLLKGIDPTETVGHELLHNADRLTMGRKMDELYRFVNTLPGGYNANSFEMRANIQGKQFADKLEKELLKRAGARKVPIE